MPPDRFDPTNPPKKFVSPYREKKKEVDAIEKKAQAAAEQALMDKFGFSDFKALIVRLMGRVIMVETGRNQFIPMTIDGYDQHDGCFFLRDKNRRGPGITYKIDSQGLAKSFDEITLDAGFPPEPALDPDRGRE